MMINEYWDRILRFFRINEWSSEFFEGFWAGIIFLSIIVFLFIILWFFRSGKRKFKGVVVKGAGGNLHISINAIRQFIHLILDELDDVCLGSVKVVDCRGQIIFEIELEVSPGVELVNLRDRLQQRVIEDAERQLGLDRPVKVNFEIRSIKAEAGKGSGSESGKADRHQSKANMAPAATVEPENKGTPAVEVDGGPGDDPGGNQEKPGNGEQKPDFGTE